VPPFVIHESKVVPCQSIGMYLESVLLSTLLFTDLAVTSQLLVSLRFDACGSLSMQQGCGMKIGTVFLSTKKVIAGGQIKRGRQVKSRSFGSKKSVFVNDAVGHFRVEWWVLLCAELLIVAVVWVWCRRWCRRKGH